MTYREAEKEIRKIRDKHGELYFRMGLYHLFDIGVRHMDDETVEETINEISHEDDYGHFMSNAAKIEIIRIAQQLAQFEMSYLLVFIQRNLLFDVMDGVNLLNMVDCFGKYVDQQTWLQAPSDIYYGLATTIGLSDAEIEYIGFGYTIPKVRYGD